MRHGDMTALTGLTIDTLIQQQKPTRDAASEVRRQASSYATFLASPASIIASNVPSRSDVSYVAILGYN